MNDLNHSRNLAVRPLACCLRLPLPLPVLTAVLVLATPAAVQAQFSYTVTNQMVTITGCTGTTDVVSIPSTINGLPVTAVGNSAFIESFLTSVTIPNSATSIGDHAFAYCSRLTSVILGSGVTSIGDYAFSGTSLTNITLGSSVTSIGDAAFGSCSSLTNITVDPLNSAFSSVDGVLFNHNQTTLVQYPGGKVGHYTIPNSVTSIGDGAFSGSRLTNVTIPDSVTSVGDFAFFGCFGLTNITLGSGLTSIGVSAFSGEGKLHGCPLINVTIPNSVTNIENGAFAGCRSLTKVTIGNSVASIGDYAFLYCDTLTSVTIPNSVTSIGDYAFTAGTTLANITLGSGVSSIGDFAFYGCSSLTNITVDPLNSTFSSVDGVLFNHNQTTLVQYPGGKVGHYTIPNSVTSIGDGAFSGSSLTSVAIPNSVTSIGDYAFYGCQSLTSLHFEGNAPSVGGTNVFVVDNAAIYYLPGTVGWGSTFAGRPTALWTLPYPLILTDNPNFGVRSNQFGFTVSWAINLNVVVEAATDLAQPIWSPVQTNTLTSGSFYFTDSQWKNYPSRFYRVRSQ